MLFKASLDKSNISFVQSTTDGAPLKVKILAIVPGVNLPFRNDSGEVVAQFQATEELIKDSVNRSRFGFLTVDHLDPAESFIGYYNSVAYEDGFVASGEILCPKWAKLIASGESAYSGVSVEGKLISGEDLEHPEKIGIYAITFLSNEKSPEGGACAREDAEGNKLCKVEVLASNNDNKKIIIVNNNDLRGSEMPTKKEVIVEAKVEEVKVEAAVVETPIETPAEPQVEASAPEVLETPAIIETPVTPAAAEILPTPAASVLEPLDPWVVIRSELGINSRDDFVQLKTAAEKAKDLEVKIDKILTENTGLKSYKMESEKKWLKETMPPALWDREGKIETLHSEMTADPVSFQMKYIDDIVRFAASKSVVLAGSAVESKETEETRKMAERIERRDSFLNKTGGPIRR